MRIGIAKHGNGESVAHNEEFDQFTQIAGVEQVARQNGAWITERVLNGDQTDQGRALQMDPHTIQVYRVRLVTYPRR